MSTRYLTKFGVAAALGATLGAACAPPPITEECVPVDEHLEDATQWCNVIHHPRDDPNLTWNGQPAGAGLPVCIAPQSDGSCKVCPRDEVLPLVEERMTEVLATSDCQPDHWELGCMRTEEEGARLGWGPDGSYDGSYYCCFEVAVWGPGCDDSQ